jgi:hypothetical protein
MSGCGPSRQAAFFGPTVANGALRTWLDLQLAAPSREWPKGDTAGRVRHHANAETVASAVHSLHTLAAAWLALSISDEAVHCKK